jgi:hypothetical protein
MLPYRLDGFAGLPIQQLVSQKPLFAAGMFETRIHYFLSASLILGFPVRFSAEHNPPLLSS